jgi:hypothetical protein
MGVRMWMAGFVCVAGCSSGSVSGGPEVGAAGSTAPGPSAGVGVAQAATGVPPAPAISGGRAAPATGGRSAGGVAGTGVSTPGASAGRPAAPGGAAGGAGSGGNSGAGSAASPGGEGVPTEKFSFFVTSLEAMREFSNNENGFGGDLRYGQATGLEGADKLCSDIAESSLPGASKKIWRAFLSTKAGGANDGPIHARDRIGNGPWYDRTGRLIAQNLTALLNTRPQGADASIVANLPNERGEPNRASEDIDNHDTVTGSNTMGQYNGGPTCEDWTTTETPTPPAAGSSGGGGRNNGGGNRSAGPMCGHSWPAQSGESWIQAHPAPGCAPSVSLVQMGGGSGTGIGNSGGYGGIYCFALSP